MSRTICLVSLVLIAGFGLMGAKATASAIATSPLLSPKTAHLTQLALNPQPEPPNKNRKNKIKKGDPGTKKK
jgi:hypothetical protein